MYPKIEPYEQGMLDAGDGHQLYWETCGNPTGKPAVVLHGGPGLGCSTGQRRFFDPDAYQVVLFDQRNCGRSTPHASDPATDLSTNTTPHLLADIELLRDWLGIERWLVFGGSWGSTLALAYAETHPERVSELVVPAVTSGRRSETEWLNRGVGRFFPEQFERFLAGLPEGERDGSLAGAYHRLLEGPDPATRTKAADDWCDWENALVSIDPNAPIEPRRLTAEFRMCYARIVTHYFANDCFLEDGVILRNAGRLAGIPGVLIHGRYDLGSPLVTAWELAKAWPDAELVIANNAGHSTGDPGMAEAILAALDRFAR